MVMKAAAFARVILLQWRMQKKKRDFRASKTTSAAHHVTVHIFTIVYQWRAAGDRLNAVQ